MEKKSLAVLANEYSDIIKAIMADAMAGEDEPSNNLQAILDETSGSIQLKTDGYAMHFDKLKADVAYWKNRAKEAADIAKAIDKASKGIKSHFIHVLENLKWTESIGQDFKLKIVENAPSVLIDSTDEIPQKFLIRTVTYSADKKAIKEAIKAGEKVPGCRLETSKSLRKYPNRGTKK